MVEIDVPNVELWSLEIHFLYDLKVDIMDKQTILNHYELPVGIRTISVNEKSILLNGKPVFLKGFGGMKIFPFSAEGWPTPLSLKITHCSNGLGPTLSGHLTIPTTRSITEWQTAKVY